MKRLLFVPAIVMAATPALADDKSDFAALYGKLRDALVAKDAPAAKALLTKDFELNDQRGTSTADEMIEEAGRMGGRMGGGMGGRPPMGPPPAGMQPPAGPRPEMPKPEITFDSVAVTGNTAKVVMRTHAAGSRKGPDGADHSFEMTRITDDVWQRKDGQWLLRSITLREMVAKRDGKEMFHYGGE